MSTDGGGVWSFDKVQWIYKKGYTTGPLRDYRYFLKRTMSVYSPLHFPDNLMIAPQLLGFWNED